MDEMVVVGIVNCERDSTCGGPCCFRVFEEREGIFEG